LSGPEKLASDMIPAGQFITWQAATSKCQHIPRPGTTLRFPTGRRGGSGWRQTILPPRRPAHRLLYRPARPTCLVDPRVGVPADRHGAQHRAGA
jgi:hypothetical protein